jgi:hypothetical protein
MSLSHATRCFFATSSPKQWISIGCLWKTPMLSVVCSPPVLCRFRFSLVNLRQRVAKIYFPPPLDVARHTQRTQKSGEPQSMNWASSSWWFIISRSQESTRSAITTVAPLLWTGSGEPARRANQHYTVLLATYNNHNAIYRSTEYTFYFPFLLLLFSSKPAWFTGHENPPNKCAKITRQKTRQ